MNLAESNYPKVEVKEPEFKRLMESLRQELNNTSELVSKISMFSCSLKQINRDNTPIKEGGPTKEPFGVVECFQEEVWRLRKQNDELLIISNHLESLIGY